MTAISRSLLRELYESGLSLRQVERHTGVPYSTVRERLIEMGVEIRKRGSGNDRRMPHDACRETAFMYEQLLMTTTEIAQKLGLAHDTVANRLRAHGVQIRSRGESLKLRFARTPKGRDRLTADDPVLHHEREAGKDLKPAPPAAPPRLV